MATKRAIELGQRLHDAHRAVCVAIPALGQLGTPSGWAGMQALIERMERAAIAVGVERERGRQAKRKGPRR